jgi:pyridoxal 5'-phosphate synthase pdxT subunit
MKVAVLAVQGAFIEHEKRMEELGVSCVELRQAADLEKDYDGIILPGGESTVQGKLLKDLGMFDRLQQQIKEGMPVLATCAGLILLAEQICNDDKAYLQTLPVVVKRNAYGRQLGSFHTEGEVKGLGIIPMEFIRAPYIESVKREVEVLGVVDEHIIMVQYKNQLAMAFHPELCECRKIHEKFVQLIVQNNNISLTSIK